MISFKILRLVVVLCSFAFTGKAFAQNDAGDATFLKISADSLDILTPGVELYNYTGKRDALANQNKYREILRSNIIISLMSELPTAKYKEIPLMKKDYLTINKVVEGQLGVSRKAPRELLVSDNKYSLAVRMLGRYGKSEGGRFIFVVIENRTETVMYYKYYDFSYSGLNIQKHNSLIKEALSKIIT